MFLLNAKAEKKSANTGIEVTLQNFEDTVLRQSFEQFVLLQFWAPWCQPCKQLSPIIEKVMTDYPDNLSLCKVNIDEQPQIAMQFRVQSVPTVFLFHKGNPIDGFMGIQSENNVKFWLSKHIGPPKINIKELMENARIARFSNNFKQAIEIYSHLINEGINTEEVKSNLAWAYFADRQDKMALELLNNKTEDKSWQKVEAYKKILKQIDNILPKESLDQFLENPLLSIEEMFDLAFQAFYYGCYEKSVNILLSILSENLNWGESKGKSLLLEILEALGSDHPLAIEGRKKYSSMVFK